MDSDDEQIEFEKKGLFEYEDQIALDKRQAESARIIQKYPTRIPLVCERVPKHIQKTTLPVLSKKKFLVPAAMTLAQFSQVVKKQVQEENEVTNGGPGSKLFRGRGVENRALYFLLRSRRSPPMTRTLADLYAANKDEDGFLYLHFGEENVFGQSS